MRTRLLRPTTASPPPCGISGGTRVPRVDLASKVRSSKRCEKKMNTNRSLSFFRCDGLPCRDWGRERNDPTTARLNVRVVIRVVLVVAALILVGVLASYFLARAHTTPPCQNEA